MSKMPQSTIEWILFETLLLVVVIILILVVLTFRKSSYPKIKIPSSLPTKGFKFKIQQVATLLTHDGLFPTITLHNNKLEYRLLIGHTVEYKDIIEISSKKFVLYGHTLKLKIKGKSWGFYPRDLWLSMGREDNLKELEAFFKEKTLKKTK